MTVTTAFTAIGFAVVVLFALASSLFVLARLYFWLIHGRFSLILLNKQRRRLSLVSWHQSRLVRKGEKPTDETADWPADDFPIGERLLYLSYRIGRGRLFIMAGKLGEHRSRSIAGKHP